MTKQVLGQKVVLACATVFLGAGCLGEDGSFGDGEDLEEISSPVTVWPAAFEATPQYGKMWRWNVEGVNVVPLTSATTSACFLNSVWGSLKGNDYVGIFSVGGTWVLKGTGADSSPSADAYCMTNVALTPEIVAAADKTLTLPVATATAHTCFITRVGGGWTSGTNEVRVEQKGTGWVLITKGVTGAARCVNRAPLPIETTWSGSGAIALHGDLTDPNMNTAFNITSTARYFCSLTRITGILNNNDGWIGTYIQPVSTGWQWYVGGKKNSISSPFTWLPPTTYPLSGAARCVQ